MELIKPGTNINFVGKNGIAVFFSLLLILGGFGSLVMKGGPNYGIDFSGGALVQVKFGVATDPTAIKAAIDSLALSGVVVQTFGDEESEFLIRFQETGTDPSELSRGIKDALAGAYGAEQVDIRRIEMVGPLVGKDLRTQAMWALIYAMIGILLYITWRFELRFALGAILALVHDVVVTVGAFSVFNKEIDLPIIAAFLAIIGYSLNDTIIIFDRIRENTGKVAKESFRELVNRSINETLARTLMTSGTTLVVVLALFFLGGGVIHNFAFALIVGILVGTYSTIFVASAFVLWWDRIRSPKAIA